MPKAKILITVKTYPTISTKYDELVCTAGLQEDGSWVRIYPIPFRKKPYVEQYKKYDWIELDTVKNKSDFRPESYRPFSENTQIKVIGHVGTKYNWRERKMIVLKKVCTNLKTLIAEAKNKNIGTSLATFKPAKILDFIYKPTSREWSKEKLNKLRQLSLFEKRNNNFQVVRKLPYKFSFVFEDDEGKNPNLMIEDWETGQLYWNCLDKYGNEKEGCEGVKKKYLDDFAKTKDLYFFLGTTKRNHFRALNPFIIIGTFHPKPDIQRELIC